MTAASTWEDYRQILWLHANPWLLGSNVIAPRTMKRNTAVNTLTPA